MHKFGVIIFMLLLLRDCTKGECVWKLINKGSREPEKLLLLWANDPVVLCNFVQWMKI
jgi:hypothetical protein